MLHKVAKRSGEAR
nr:unnamed protein product [Callosobruchus chinensis]